MKPINKNEGFAGLVAILLILVVAGAGYYYWYMQKPAVNQNQQTQPNRQTTNSTVQADTSTGLGTELYDEAQNPAKDSVPETNPFALIINPFAE